MPRRALPTAIVAAYSALGSILLYTRFVGLGRGFWHDEIVTVRDYVRAGPVEILTGTYIPNNHQLFSMVGWATTLVAGPSELALRLWSVIPFLAGVALVTAWLHLRVGAFTGVLYLFFCTLSPLMLDISRQARGYGLTWLAMSVLVVGAFEIHRSRRTWTIVVFCAAGLVGTLTLPIFVIAFAATAGVVFTNRDHLREAAFPLAGSVLGILAWYAPHFDDLVRSSGQEFGAPIPWFAIFTSPLEQILIPALLWIDGPALTRTPLRFPLIALLLVPLVASPLLRDRRAALVLGSGVAATLLVVWVTRLSLMPRFVSYLLVPLLILLASGSARLLARPTGRSGVWAVAAIVVVGYVPLTFLPAALDITRLPREAHRDAVEIIRERAPADTPVLVYNRHPSDVEYYLERPVETLLDAEVVSAVCGRESRVAYVVQPLGVVPVTVPCLDRARVEHYRFEQYTRGDEINVWLVPPGR